ncbi:MAG: hypothetical protein AAGC57_16105 [Pseudomonadota bacterium]
MVYIYEAVIGAGLVLIARWVWRVTNGSPTAGLLIAALLVSFFWPWVVYADWGAVLRVAATGLVVGLTVLGYARVLAAARRAAENRPDSRPDPEDP